MSNQTISHIHRAGVYCWAGPGTERMIRLKYPTHKIDRRSLWQSYDQEQLQQARDTLGITDAWVSYSWGFSEQTEQADYQFLRDRLVNFQRLGIKTHAYVQGTNLVWAEHQDTDYYCRDYRGRLIPYHRGRKLTCPNNPAFQAYLHRKVALALEEEVDGVFVDNMHFGLFPVMLGKGRFTFFGCQCAYCQEQFKREVGSPIPGLFHRQSELFEAYIDFRVRGLMALVRALAAQIHASGKAFGTNSFDPRYETRLFYGTDLQQLAQVQDYLLFENHHLPSKKRSNAYLQPLVSPLTLPVFVVSYHKGIGREKQYSQADLNAVYSESQALGYAPCYKASEYTTKHVWHNMRFEQLQPVHKVESRRAQAVTLESDIPRLPGGRWLSRVFNRFYVPAMERYYENKLVRRSMAWLFYRVVR
ncbi:MAG: hypothetical protein K8J31_04940 [Anaerolineae bacterium]|nr:hypothetical protein [Anaerolineae bacterium]